MRVSLLGGAYQALSVIANAQACINLYPEANQQDTETGVPVTHYLTPGLDLQVTSPLNAPVRCTYRASNGDPYVVIGPNVYYVTVGWTLTLVGTVTNLATPISMADNGIAIVIVDGSTSGWAINMATRQFAPITGAAFYGSTRADYCDTFFIFNKPGTAQMYISASEASFDMLTGPPGAVYAGSIDVAGSGYSSGTFTGVTFSGGNGTGFVATVTVVSGAVTVVTPTSQGVNYQVGDVLSPDSTIGPGSGLVYSVEDIHGSAFDPLDFAAKSGYPDPLVGVIVMHRELWLIGQLTTEIWYDSGAADFAFQAMPGAFIEHGCAAPYSIAAQDLSVFWLSQDKQGQCIVFQGSSYMAKRISTNAIENAIRQYPKITDAIGFCYQEEGHVFYVLTFPTADATWVYDASIGLWHQRTWTDNQGVLHRHRANCVMNAYSKIICGDWQNGSLYHWNIDTYTDVGQPISRIRSMPHFVQELNRVTYASLIADMEVGSTTGADGSTQDNPPMVSLDWSDDRGVTYGNKIEQSAGAVGQYLTSIQYRRLGQARDRVFRLSWSFAAKTALQGVSINVVQAMT